MLHPTFVLTPFSAKKRCPWKTELAMMSLQKHMASEPIGSKFKVQVGGFLTTGLSGMYGLFAPCRKESCPLFLFKKSQHVLYKCAPPLHIFLLPHHRQLTVPMHPFATRRYKARSPFSALGGVGDQFRSPVDLCKNCRTRSFVVLTIFN